LVLIVILIYIFAVMVTTLYRDAFDEGITSDDYFGQLDFAFFTLFQILSLDNWVDITRELMTEYKSAWLVMVAYVVFGGVVLFNVFVAIFQDSLVELKKMKNSVQISRGSFRDLDHLSTYSTNLYVSKSITVLEKQVGDLLELHQKTQEALDALDKHLTHLNNVRVANELPSRPVEILDETLDGYLVKEKTESQQQHKGLFSNFFLYDARRYVAPS